MSLRNLPSVDELLSEPVLQALIQRYDRRLVVQVVREEVDTLRTDLRKAGADVSRETLRAQIAEKSVIRLHQLTAGTLKKVINGTGVVFHTNLGRAVLPGDVADRIRDLAAGYTNLEINLSDGSRGSRYDHIEPMLRTLLGCEAALVVNNNAAAVFLALNTIAREQEVIVSRGQLVEIGGSFRVPEIMNLSGASLVEVGTTNKTYLRDFERAVTDQTALLLGVHTSNYRIVGFTNEISLEELARLGQQRGIPTMFDLGSGTMIDLTEYGLSPEPTIRQCLASGIDLVTFSGDKLLGGPQAGIIAGKREWIDRMKQNHLLRALRVDKITIAALEAVLALYLAADPVEQIPGLAMLTASQESLRARAGRLARSLRGVVPKHARVSVIRTTDRVGGGAYPIEELPGSAVQIAGLANPDQIAAWLRTADTPLLARIQEDAVQISVRALLPGEERIISGLFARCFKEELA